MTLAAMSGSRFDFGEFQSNGGLGDVLKVDFFDGAKAPAQAGAGTAGARGAAAVAGETLASGALRIGGAVLTANAVLQSLHSAAERSQVHAAIEKFKLDPNDARDVLAARAYVWGHNMGPNIYWKLPYSGPVNERVATALMRLERLAPTTLGQAVSGNAAARLKIDSIVEAAIAGPVDTPTMRRIAGVDAPTETNARARPALAGLDLSGERRRDDTCAPNGTRGDWVVVNRSMTPEARRYQEQVARTPDLPGKLMVEYQVTNLRTERTAMFDGCATWDRRHQLLDAKTNQGLFGQMAKYPALDRAVRGNMISEANRQSDAVNRSHPIEWHVANAAAVPLYKRVIGEATAPTTNVIYTAPR